MPREFGIVVMADYLNSHPTLVNHLAHSYYMKENGHWLFLYDEAAVNTVGGYSYEFYESEVITLIRVYVRAEVEPPLGVGGAKLLFEPESPFDPISVGEVEIELPGGNFVMDDFSGVRYKSCQGLFRFESQEDFPLLKFKQTEAPLTVEMGIQLEISPVEGEDDPHLFRFDPRWKLNPVGAPDVDLSSP